MIFPTMWYVQPTKAQISMRIRTLILAFAGHLNILCLSGYCMASQMLINFLNLNLNIKPRFENLKPKFINFKPRLEEKVHINYSN